MAMKLHTKDRIIKFEGVKKIHSGDCWKIKLVYRNRIGRLGMEIARNMALVST